MHRLPGGEELLDLLHLGLRAQRVELGLAPLDDVAAERRQLLGVLRLGVGGALALLGRLQRPLRLVDLAPGGVALAGDGALERLRVALGDLRALEIDLGGAHRPLHVEEDLP